MATRFSKFLLMLCLIGLGLAACSPEEREANYIKRGNKQFELGEYAKARVEYKNAARIKPTDPEVAYRFGLVDEAQGNFRGAFDNFIRAEQQNAHYAPALLKLCEYYIAGEQYDQAQKRIGIVLTDAPDNADAHALQAALMLRYQKYEDTEKEARFALSKDPANATAYSVLTGLYKAQGDKAKALATIEEGISRNPKSLPLLLIRSSIYEQSGDLDKIAAAYDAIFKLTPKDTHYRLELAHIYLKAGKIDEAEKVMRAGVEAAPNNWEMKRQLVTFLGDNRGMDAAEKEIRIFMQAHPDKVELNRWLVELYMSHEAMDKAVAFLDQVIADHPDDPQGVAARTALAQIDYIQGDKDKAGKLTSHVLESAPDNVEARFLKARLEYDHGYYQNAIIDLRSIIRDRPKAKQALLLLGEAFLQQRHPDLAIDTVSQAADIDPLDFAVRVRLAQLYHLNGDSSHAMDILFLVTKADPKFAVAWETIARIALDTKDWSTAESAIRTLDGLEGQHKLAAFLRGDLLARTGKNDEAIALYKEVINADPTSTIAERALVSLVSLYGSLKQMDQASSYIESLKEKNPSLNTILGETYLVSGKREEAAVNLDKAIGANPSQPEPYLDRARMFASEGKYKEALDVLSKGISAAPQDMRLLLMQAQLLGEVGRYQEAIVLYDGILARNPDFDAVANNLAEIIADYDYENPAALEKARHIAERFASSPNPLFLDTLAWVYYRQNKINEAQSIMERALSSGKELPQQIHYHNGAILIKASKHAEAKAELQKATIEGADYPGREQARKLLEGL